MWFSFGQQVFESISFWSFKVGFQLFGVLVNCGFHSVSESLSQFILFRQSWLLNIWRVGKSCFFVIVKVYVVCENLVCLTAVSFFQPVSLQVLPHLTKRAPDLWESARFTSIFLASGFSYISKRISARPKSANANR